MIVLYIYKLVGECVGRGTLHLYEVFGEPYISTNWSGKGRSGDRRSDKRRSGKRSSAAFKTLHESANFGSTILLGGVLYAKYSFCCFLHFLLVNFAISQKQAMKIIASTSLALYYHLQLQIILRDKKIKILFFDC